MGCRDPGANICLSIFVSTLPERKATATIGVSKRYLISKMLQPALSYISIDAKDCRGNPLRLP